MLKNLAKDVLLPFYRDLFAFFDEIFDKRDSYHFVLFIARRCSNLMEIFFRLSDRRDEEFPANFITENAMFSLIPVFVRYYRRNKRFPSILIVDDIVIYGRTLDTFLRELKERLRDELVPCGVSREAVAAALARAVHIRTFARNNQPLLLASCYQSGFTAAEVMEPAEWRDLSNRISRLILLRGQVNSCFISGAELVPNRGAWDALYEEGFSRIKTTYDAFPQTMFCRTLRLPKDETVIYTVRLFSSSVDRSTVAAPFVFLPNLPADVMSDMLLMALEKCGLRCGRWFDAAEACQRIWLELLVLLLSTSLLNEFCRLTGTTPRYNGRIKLQMNFATAMNSDIGQFVDFILDPGTKLLSLDEMDGLFTDARISRRSDARIAFRRIDLPMKADGSEQLKEELENEVYQIGLHHYAQAYWETQMYMDDTSEKDEGYFTTAPELFDRFSESYGKRSLPHMVSWIFQMADAGILAITIQKFHYGRNDYVGQCLKTGEQSQFIMPKRLRDFIPVLTYIQRRAYIFDRDFRQELRRFADINEDIRDNQDEIGQFLMDMEVSGQKLEDWDIGLVTFPASDSENWTEEIKAARRSVHRQRKLMEDYERLIKA